MRGRVKYVIYAALALAVLVVHYVVPYTALRNSADFTLYTFWTLLSAAWIAATIVFIERWWG